MKKISLNELKYITYKCVDNIIKEMFINKNGLTNIDDYQYNDLVGVAKNKGFEYIAYHAQQNNIIKFHERNNSGIHFGTIKAANDRTLADINDRTVTPYFLKINKPLIINKDFDWEGEHLDDDPNWDILEDELCIESYLYKKGFKLFVYDDKGNVQYMKTVRDTIAEKGYDAIIYKNQMEDKGNYSIAMFNTNNIKLATPNTYDDNNKTIPLEKRFNTNVNDVRF